MVFGILEAVQWVKLSVRARQRQGCRGQVGLETSGSVF